MRHHRQRRHLPVSPTKPRVCGTCTACCTVMGVKELGKPAHEPCRFLVSQVQTQPGVHLAVLKGCAQYVDRPQSCRGFECLWLRKDATGIVPGEHRPDRCGLVLDITDERSDLPRAAIVHEVWPGASEEEAGRQLIAHLSRHAVVVVRPAEGPGRMVGPAAMVEQYQRHVAKVAAEKAGAA